MNLNNYTNTKNLISVFKKNGFVVSELFDKNALEDFALAFQDLINMQMRKLNLDKGVNISDDIVALNKINGK